MSTYSSKPDAYAAAKDAGNGFSPRSHGKHEYDRYGKLKRGVYFNHYHSYLNSVTYDSLGFEIAVGHVCYGQPSINL